MCGCYSTDRATVNSNLASNFELFNEELHDTFTIELGFVWIDLLEESGGGLTVASVIPAQHIAVTFEEEIEPVGIGLVNHLLVDEGIWIANHYCRLAEVVSLRVFNAHLFL